MKYKFVKAVRFRGEDKKIGDVIDIIQGCDEYISLMQVNAIEEFKEEEVKEVKESKENKKKEK